MDKACSGQYGPPPSPQRTGGCRRGGRQCGHRPALVVPVAAEDGDALERHDKDALGLGGQLLHLVQHVHATRDLPGQDEVEGGGGAA